MLRRARSAMLSIALMTGPPLGAHGQGGSSEGSAALLSPRLSGQSDWYLLRQIAGFRDGWRVGAPEDPGAARMGVAVQTLTDQQAVLDVVAFINTLAPTAR